MSAIASSATEFINEKFNVGYYGDSVSGRNVKHMWHNSFTLLPMDHMYILKMVKRMLWPMLS